MLIRSDAWKLERTRVPLGELRVSEFARSLDVRGLWIFSPRYLTIDLTGNSPPLTWQGAATIDSGIEGPSMDSAPSSSSGARITFGTDSPLTITTGGMTAWCRLERNTATPANNATYFGITYQGLFPPYRVCNIMSANGSATDVRFEYAYGSNLQSTVVNAVGYPLETPINMALAREFGSFARGYVNGAQILNNTTNTSAPTYGGTTDVLAFGYDGLATNNPQARFYTGAIFGTGLDAGLIAALEAEPYSTVEQKPSFLSMMSSAPATAPGIVVTGNGNEITDGDTTQSATDHTDFETTPEGTTKSRTFTITNDGDADLIISSVALSGAGAGEFTITSDPTGTIPHTTGNTDTLVIRADAATQGTFEATVTINSNAPGGLAAFTFDIQVEVTEPPAGSSDGGGGVLFGTLGSIQMSPVVRRRRSKGKGFF